MRGANQQALLDLINKHASGDDSIEDEPRVKGFVSIPLNVMFLILAFNHNFLYFYVYYIFLFY